MEPILDQKSNDDITKSKLFKKLSGLSLGLVFLINLSVFVYVYYEKENNINPYLPQFTYIYVFHRIINFSLLQSCALLPVIFFHFLKHYKFSVISYLVILIFAWVFRDSVEFYLWFY